MPPKEVGSPKSADPRTKPGASPLTLPSCRSCCAAHRMPRAGPEKATGKFLVSHGLGDVGGDAPGLVAGELGPRQRLPAHGEKMLAYKAE